MQPLLNSSLCSSTVYCGCSRAFFRFEYIESSCLDESSYDYSHIIHSFISKVLQTFIPWSTRHGRGRETLARRFSIQKYHREYRVPSFFSSELGPPPPHPSHEDECVPRPAPPFLEGTHACGRKGAVWETQFGRGDRHCGTLGTIYVLCEWYTLHSSLLPV